MAFDFLGGCPNCDSLWLPPRAAYLIALSWRDSPPPLRLLPGPRLSSSPQLRATALGLVIECGWCQVAVRLLSIKGTDLGWEPDSSSEFGSGVLSRLMADERVPVDTRHSQFTSASARCRWRVVCGPRDCPCERLS